MFFLGSERKPFFQYMLLPFAVLLSIFYVLLFLIYIHVFLCVFSRAPRFKGYQQQDSQELLHYLLDSIRVEETKVSLHILSHPRVITDKSLAHRVFQVHNVLGWDLLFHFLFQKGASNLYKVLTVLKVFEVS